MSNRVLISILERLQEHDRRIGASNWRGKVTDVDPEKALARVELGKDEDGAIIKSPWLPYAQTAGALKAHIPPTVGQVMSMRGSSGDIEQGTLEASHWSDDNQSPSQDGGKNVITFGNVTVDLSGDGLTLSCGGVTWAFSGSGFTQTGGLISHDGKIIDKTHKHTGVIPGGGTTGTPQ